MSVPLFATTKFRPPSLRAGHVRRAGLCEALEAADLPLTVLIAPPGAGKTVTLVDWVTGSGAPSAWLSCERRDRDPVTFWSALAESVDLRWPGTGSSTRELLGAPVPDIEAASISLLNAIVPSVGTRVLVLDDFHLIEGPVETTMGGFVAALPESVRVVIGSRSDPDLALPRLRASEQLLELRNDALRLGADEAEAMLGNLGVDLASAEVRELVEQTEGWAAGLQLAAVSLRATSGAGSVLGGLTETRRAISEYLFSEALARQPVRLGRFLLEASVFDEFDAALCRAVLGMPDAADLIEDCLHRSLFLVRLADGDTYRFHRLFRALLTSQLHTSDPDRENALHIAAAEHLEKTDRIELAIRHLIAVGDHSQALQVFSDHIVDGYLRGGPQGINLWLAEFDDDHLEDDPSATVTVAQALVLGGAVEQSKRWLARAQRMGWVDEDDRGHGLIVEAYLAAFEGRCDEVTELVAEARAAVTRIDGVVATLAFVACQALIWAGDLDAARVEYKGAVSAPNRIPIFEDVLMIGQLAQILVAEGDLDAAIDRADAAIASAERNGLADRVLTASSRLARSDVLREWGRLDEAIEEAARAFAAAEVVRPPYAFQAQIRLGRAALATGDLARAVAAVDLARTFVPGEATPLHDELVDLAARVALAAGDLRRARSERQRVHQDRIAALLDARMHLAAGKHRQALTVLDAAPCVLPADRIECSLLGATAHLMLGDDPTVDITAAIELAAQHGYLQRMLDHAGDLEPHLSRILRRRDATRFDQRLRDALDALTLFVPVGAGPRLVEPLSTRELEVLRCLSSRRSQAEIADELFVSVNTVKTHTKAIYRKLGVTTRNEAVRAAREHGLL